jgi:small subunit ribosomal protein S15e
VLGKRTMKRFFFRGVEVSKLLDLSHGELMDLMHARVRRRFARGHVPLHLIKRLRKARKGIDEAAGEKPPIVKTHLRNMVVLPEMVGCQIAVYNGLGYAPIEVKPQMIGHYLGEFSTTYKPVAHGRAGKTADVVRLIPV